MRIESLANATLFRAVRKDYGIDGRTVASYQLMIEIGQDAENVKCTEQVYEKCSAMAMGSPVTLILEYNTDNTVKKSGSLRIVNAGRPGTLELSGARPADAPPTGRPTAPDTPAPDGKPGKPGK